MSGTSSISSSAQQSGDDQHKTRDTPPTQGAIDTQGAAADGRTSSAAKQEVLKAAPVSQSMRAPVLGSSAVVGDEKSKQARGAESQLAPEQLPSSSKTGGSSQEEIQPPSHISSPAKRGASDYTCGGQTSEKRSRARGPSGERELVRISFSS